MGDAEIGQRIDDGIDDDAERRGNAAIRHRRETPTGGSWTGLR